MSVGLLTILLLGSVIVLLALGLPVAFCLGGVAAIFLYLGWMPPYYQAVYWDTSSVLGTYSYIAIPLFVFMASMLERSGVADDLYGMMHRWIGHLAGGLAMGTVIICTILAAMVGLSASASVMMGVIALPAMLKRGYDKRMIMGSIAAGGTLGVLVPPSVLMLVYYTTAFESPRRLFMAGVIPGLLLAFFFILYIGIRCRLQPRLGPPIPPAERPAWRERFGSLQAMLLPVFLIIIVLGSIFTGITTITESAAVGAAGSIICAAVLRKLSWHNFKETNFTTLKLSCMIMWILIAAEVFTRAYVVIGAYGFLEQLSAALPLGKWGIIILMQLIWFIMGCFLDPFSIVLVTVPAFAPIVQSLGFDLVWFGVLFVVNMEMAYLTPPVGLNLFILKAVAPEGTTMLEVYSSVAPFVLILGIGLVLIMLFPQIALWLPNLVYGAP
jgi:tripartite ATP-independent transporter DctM subunit